MHNIRYTTLLVLLVQIDCGTVLPSFPLLLYCLLLQTELIVYFTHMSLLIKPNNEIQFELI